MHRQEAGAKKEQVPISHMGGNGGTDGSSSLLGITEEHAAAPSQTLLAHDNMSSEKLTSAKSQTRSNPSNTTDASAHLPWAYIAVDILQKRQACVDSAVDLFA